MNWIIVVALIGVSLSIPTNFDLRTQSERLRYADYDLRPEGICAGYAWAKELAQIVGNAVGLSE